MRCCKTCKDELEYISSENGLWCDRCQAMRVLL